MPQKHEEPARTRRNVPAIVVMGVSGCGKSVVGKALAEEFSAAFVEGDALHPAENVALMSAGKPLDDERRWGWLDAIGNRLSELIAEDCNAVASCSALKRKYRERLEADCPGILFIYLEIDRATARQRVSGRKGHFMPASLVESQFAALEPPGSEENAVTVDATAPVAAVIAAATQAVAASLEAARR